MTSILTALVFFALGAASALVCKPIIDKAIGKASKP